MANTNITRPDLSRFGLRSYGWRKVPLKADRIIDLLEKSYQTAKGISGIMEAVQLNFAEDDDSAMSPYELDQLMAAAKQLSNSLLNELCAYASSLDQQIRDSEKAAS